MTDVDGAWSPARLFGRDEVSERRPLLLVQIAGASRSLIPLMSIYG